MTEVEYKSDATMKSASEHITETRIYTSSPKPYIPILYAKVRKH